MSRGTIRDQFGPENKWKWTKWRHDKSKERIYRNGTCMTSPKYCRTMVGSPLSPQCVVPQGCRGQCHQGEACASALSIGCQDNEAISSTRQEEDLVTTSGQGRGNATGNARMSGMTEEMKGNVFPAETSKFGRCLPPVILLFSRDLLVLELKIKTYRLIDTLWLLSMRPRHEVIKNNSSCHYPNNSVGLSDCNPVWPSVIPSTAIVRLQFHDLWGANSPPNKSKTRARVLCASLGERSGVAMPKFSLSWGSPKITTFLGRACHRVWLRTFYTPLEWRFITAFYQNLHKVCLCRWDKVSTPDWKKEGEERERGSEPKNPNT